MRGQTQTTQLDRPAVALSELANRRDAPAIVPAEIGTNLLGARLLAAARTASAIHAQAASHADREGEAR